MKVVFLALLLASFSVTDTHAQILKKIKDKANKVLNEKNTSPSTEENTNDGNEKQGQSKTDEQAPLDPKLYTLVYKPSDPDNKTRFLYDESCLGINADGSGYMLVIYDGKNRSEPFTVVEDGKVTGTYARANQLPTKCGGKINRRGSDQGSSGIDFKDETQKNMNKYVKSETKGGMPSHTVTINGKSYGPFMAITNLYVSPDGKQFFLDAYDGTAVQSIYFNGQKVSTGEPGNMMLGEPLVGPDNKTMVYLGHTAMAMANAGKEDIKGIVIYPDGTKKDITLTGAELFNPKQYRLTAKNEICWLDKLSGQFYADGKPMGKFTDNGNKIDLKDGHYQLLAGADAKTSVLFTEDGKIHFLDGSSQELTLFPFITVSNGVTTIKWFKTRGNEVYLGQYAVK